MCLFTCIVSNSYVNKMDSHNMAVCIAPSIFHKLDRPSDVESSFQAIAFIKYLIDNCEVLFGADTLSLLISAESILSKRLDTHTLDEEFEKVDSQESAGTDLNEPNSETTIKKPSLKSSLIQRRDIGRMLNLVTLKSRKSLAPKFKSKNSASNSTTVNSHVSQSEPEILLKNNSKVQLNRLEVKNVPEMEIFVTESSEICEITDESLKNETNRRRTSTNNSNPNQNASGAMIILDDETDAEVTDKAHNDLDDDEVVVIDDEEEERVNHTEEEYYDMEDCITIDLNSSNPSQSQLRNKHRINNGQKRNLKQRTKNESSLKPLNANSKHDLSSNTLSVDSGLSVPTATNSDPESEKSSAGLNKRDEISNKLEDVIAPMNEDEEYEDVSKSESNFYFDGSNEESTSCSNLNRQAPHLKRQRRMLALKSSLDEVEAKTKRPSSIMKQFSESDAVFYESKATPSIEKNNNVPTEFSNLSTVNPKPDLIAKVYFKRNSLKSIAPLAPPLLKQIEQQTNPAQNQQAFAYHSVQTNKTDSMSQACYKINPQDEKVNLF